MADYVPAIKGKMGDWTYYITAMKMGKIAREVTFASEIHKGTELDEVIQREIGKRVEVEMVPYLLHQPQRFYGALIVAVYGGDPEFSPVSVAEHSLLNDDERTSYGFGLLRFDGSQQYFALDGQHRLKSIQLAVQQNYDLASEEVAVIILKHENSLDGMKRTRRLFSTLNRRAEKTKVGLNIAIDEDDPVAITTRRLVSDHRYWGGLKAVKARKEDLAAKQLSTNKTDENYLTTLQTLYECNEFLLGAFKGGRNIDAKFKSERPSDDTLDDYFEFLSLLWTAIWETAPDLERVREGHGKPGDLRVDKRAGGGGSAIGRPIGQLVVAEVLMRALNEAHTKNDPLDPRAFLTRLFAEVSFNLDDAPWRKLLWNPDGRTMLSGGTRRTLTVQLILDKFGLKIPVTRVQLRDRYRTETQDKTMKLLRAPARSLGTNDPDAGSRPSDTGEHADDIEDAVAATDDEIETSEA